MTEGGWLVGKRVLITRPREQAVETASMFEARGAIAVIVPSIAIAPPSDPGPLLEALRTLDSFDWVVFSSANGARSLTGLRQSEGSAGRPVMPWAPKVGAVGPATAKALEDAGVAVTLIATEFVSDSLADGLIAELGTSGVRSRILVVQGDIARDTLATRLSAAGHHVTTVCAYRTTAPHSAGPTEPADPTLSALFDSPDQRIDAVAFASPSAVRSLVFRLGGPSAASPHLAQCVIGSIGPVTTKAATDLGVHVDITADPHTVEGLIQAFDLLPMMHPEGAATEHPCDHDR